MATMLPEQVDSPRVEEFSVSPMESSGSQSVWRIGRKLLLGVLIVAGVGMVGFAAWTLASDIRSPDSKLVFYKVKRADLLIKVTESGSLQSQTTTELRCEVENIGREREGTQILTIVPNGDNVKKGDLLVELDSAMIQDRLDEQALTTERARSTAIQANVKFENQKTQNETTFAEAELQVKLDKLAVEQYEDEEGGTFQIDLQDVDLRIQTARAKQLIMTTDLRAIESLKKLGYRSKGQLAQARLTAMAADRELAISLSQRTELVDYTYQKTKLQLEGALASAKRASVQVGRDNEALYVQTEASKNEADRLLEKEEARLAKYSKQLQKCKIYAPHDGMATYAIERDRRTHVGEGKTVRERQRIITLPDLTVMEVKTGVHESVLDSIHVGLHATITVDAFADRKYKGSVKSVAVLADPGEWHSSDVKVYTTIVTIDEEVERLRPGMSTVVEIHVERVKNVLSVPVQAIVQVAKDNWCYVDADGAVELRMVTVGKTNDKFVEIREGLEEGDRVVLNPMAMVDQGQDDGKEFGPESDLDAADEYGHDGDAQKTGKSPGDKPPAKSKPTAKSKAIKKSKATK